MRMGQRTWQSSTGDFKIERLILQLPFQASRLRSGSLLQIREAGPSLGAGSRATLSILGPKLLNDQGAKGGAEDGSIGRMEEEERCSGHIHTRCGEENGPSR